MMLMTSRQKLCKTSLTLKKLPSRHYNLMYYSAVSVFLHGSEKMSKPERSSCCNQCYWLQYIWPYKWYRKVGLLLEVGGAPSLKSCNRFHILYGKFIWLQLVGVLCFALKTVSFLFYCTVQWNLNKLGQSLIHPRLSQLNPSSEFTIQR